MIHLFKFFLLCVLCITSFLYSYAEEQLTITHVIDGDTLITSAGENVRLLSINTPERARGPNAAEEMAEEAKQALAAFTGKVIRLEFDGKQRDRYGRQLAHIHTADGVWLNKYMIDKGWAHVYSFPDNRSHLDELKQAEANARRLKKGIWALERWQVRDATEPFSDDMIGQFHIVEGRVVTTAKVRGTTYLNFGTDWRKDFSVEIRTEALELFKEKGINPVTDYRSKRLRVRGPLKPVNGVLITVSHPEQIAILR